MFSRSFYKYIRIEITLLVKLTWVILIRFLSTKQSEMDLKSILQHLKFVERGAKTQHVFVLADAK